MMDNLLLHPQTRRTVEQLLPSPPHALLLIGPLGSGKGTLARSIALAILGMPHDKLDAHPYARLISPEGSNISIEQVRSIQRFLQLKTTGQGKIRRVVIIEQAPAMGAEAQNALLKTLEEPPADTLLILTSEGDRQLLPTIQSRLQSIRLAPPEEAAISKFFLERGYAKTAVAKAYRLCGGLMGLMTAMLENFDEQPAVQAIEQAKQLLAANRFERLAMVEPFSKDKAALQQLLEAMVRIARAALVQAAKQGQAANQKRWHGILSQAFAAQVALRRNVNAKLLLTDFVLSI